MVWCVDVLICCPVYSTWAFKRSALLLPVLVVVIRGQFVVWDSLVLEVKDSRLKREVTSLVLVENWTTTITQPVKKGTASTRTHTTTAYLHLLLCMKHQPFSNPATTQPHPVHTSHIDTYVLRVYSNHFRQKRKQNAAVYQYRVGRLKTDFECLYV